MLQKQNIRLLGSFCRDRYVMEMNKIFAFLFIFLFGINQLNAEQSDPAHEVEVTAISFSSSGKYIITAGKDRKIRLWNSENGELIYAKEVDIIPQKLYVSPNDRYLIITQNAGKNTLYSLESGEKIKDLLIEEVKGFSPDSKSIITVTYANDGQEKYASLGFANLEDDQFIKYFSHSRIYLKDGLRNPSITNDGSKILLADDSEEMYIFKKEDLMGEEKLKLDLPLSVIGILPADTAFLIDGSSKLYSLKDGTAIDFLEEPTISDENSVIQVKGTKIINYSENELKIFDLAEGKLTEKQDISGYSIKSIDPYGHAIAYVENGIKVKVKYLFGSEKSMYLSAADIREKIAYQNYLQGIYFLQAKKYLKARDYFTKAEEKKVKASKLYYLRGEAQLNMGFSEQAIQDFLIDHALHPGRSCYKLAEAFASISDAETSVQWLDSAIHYGHHVDGMDLQNNGKFAPVKNKTAFQNKVRELLDPEVQKLVAQSNSRLYNKEALAGLEFINKAIELDHKNADLYRTRAKIYLQLHEYEKARKDYLTEARLDTFNKAESYLYVALTYSKKGDLVNTIAWIKKAIKTDSSFTFSLLDVAELYESKYRRDLALATLNEYIKLVPIDHYALYLRASMMPMEDVALEEVKKAIEHCKEQGDRVPEQYTQLLSSLNASARK